MKNFIRSLCLAALLLTGSASLMYAQEPVSTGTIAGYQPKEGTLTIKSDQTHTMITFFGVDKANIFTADGKPMMLQSLELGSKVTVQYAVRGSQWYISKVILPAAMPAPGAAGAAQAAPAGGGLQINAEPSVNNSAVKARDGDITTSADSKQQKVERVKVVR